MELTKKHAIFLISNLEGPPVDICLIVTYIVLNVLGLANARKYE